ncbi:response regulator transcription factor [Hydrogenimonas cancrithermarum]|uniref:DNA-binding response regulator n=1 Tax=Hydrogenimonas cancrithermarum TaxID=2993563 RepID=A0ABM8FLW8_9BACT|nr:response regulator transcription factor [Hydrogenimonas cancrithermarum]BDY12732.1 DNA-binding response regulator [Hydrogenimonas cancrithermarum]
MEQKDFIRAMKRCTVLYVEDDHELRAYISEFLRRFCKDIYEAENAENAYDLYLRKHPEIILLDINLPGMSGIDFCETIRRKDARTRIIMSTAYTDKDFLLKVVELGLTRYLVKPMTSEELFGAFDKALQELEAIDNRFGAVDLGEGFFYQSKAKCLYKGDETIPLRKKEIQLLDFFIDHQEEVVSYELLEQAVWPDGAMTPNAIRSQIRNLRRKTHDGILENISGIGYRLYRKPAS